MRFFATLRMTIHHIHLEEVLVNKTLLVAPVLGGVSGEIRSENTESLWLNVTLSR